MRRALILAGAALLLLPATAAAIQITKHKTTRDPLTHKVIHASWTVDVAPGDSDDDGCRNSLDDFSGPGCQPPPKPAPVVTPQPPQSSYAPPAPVTPSVTTTSGGYTIPDYIVQCESGGSYTAQNASGAYGAYQIMPSTSSAYGCDMSTPAGQDACAAEIYADVGSSAWSCG